MRLWLAWLLVSATAAEAQVLIREVASREVTVDVGGFQTPTLREAVSREISIFIENGRTDRQVASREMSVVITTAAPPPQVTGYLVTPSPTGDSVLLDWSNYNTPAIADVVRFEIYILDSPFTDVTGLTPIRTVSGETVTATIGGLTALRDHFIAIVAVDALGNRNPTVLNSAAYILTPQVVSREVSLFIGAEPPTPRQVVSREIDLAITSTAAPPRITGVTVAASPSGDAATLDWSVYNQWAVRDIARFDIYASDSAAFTSVAGFTPVASVSGGATSFLITGLVPGRDHYFAIVAVDALGNFDPLVNGAAAYVLLPQLVSREVSLFIGAQPTPSREIASREISVVRPDAAVPAPVTGVGSGFTAITSTTAFGAVNLDWTAYNEVAQGDVARYRIYVGPVFFDSVVGLTPYAIVQNGQQRATLTGLTGLGIFNFAVVAEDVLGGFDPAVRSTSAQASISSVGEVQNLAVTGGPTSLNFTWTAPPDAGAFLQGYRVYFGGAAPVSLPATATSFAAPGLAPATGYLFRITTLDPFGGESAGVSLQSATTLPNPQNLALGFAQNQQVVLTWSAVQPTALVRYYAVYRSATPFTSVAGLTPFATVNSPAAILGTLAQVTDQYFAVTTVNVSNLSDPAVTPVQATKLGQTITFPALTPGPLVIPLVATASSGLPVRFESDPAFVAAVSGNQLLVAQGGTVVVSAIQDGDDAFWPASATQTLRLPPVIRSLTANGVEVTNGLVLTRETTVAVDARDADGIARADFYGRVPGAPTWTLLASDTTPANGLTALLPVGVLPDGAYETRVVVTTPSGFSTERIHSITLALQPVLTLSFTGDSLLEGGSLTGTVSLQRARPTPLTVTVSSTRPTQLDVGAPITIPLGQTSAPITITGLQDSVIEPVEEIAVRVTAPGAIGAERVVNLLDDDWPVLTLTVDRTAVSEADGASAIQARITRDLVTSEPLTVWFTNTNTGAVSVPEQIVIPASQAAADFLIGAVNDAALDGTQTAAVRGEVRLGALGAIVQSNIVSIDVGDDEGPTLELTFAAGFLREGRTGPLVVRRNLGPTSAALTVALAVNDATELQAPPTVTIPIGEREATATLTALDDATADGSQPVLVTATASGYAPGQASLVVTDETLPDLVADRVSAPVRVDSESEFDVSYRIENRGDAPVAAAFTQRILFSRDRVPGDDILLRQYEFPGGLNAGVGFGRRETVRAPREAGTYYLLVTTDVANAIPEVIETNNTAFFTQPIVVDAAYTATVAAGVDVVPANTPIPLTGSATKTGGTPAAFSLVNIHIRRGGTERIIAALTNSTGDFSTSWQPLPGEGGEYEIGATHPGVATAPTQDTFAILTAAAAFPTDPVAFDEGDTATFNGTISNPTLRGLTGLTLAAIDAPVGLTVIVTLPGTSLGAGQSLNVGVQVAAGSGFSGDRTITLRLLTAEGVRIDVPVKISVRPLVPRLVLEPASLSASVVRGTQKTVSFTIRNTGAIESGPINLLLPALPWLASASPTPLPTIPPGDSASVSLNLSPGVTEALTQHTGNFVLSPARGTPVNAPFAFRIVSALRGDFEVEVVDEYYYFTAAAPKVEGATAILRDAITAEEIARVTTGANGLAAFPNLAEGWYALEVDSPNHTPAKGNFYVNAGETNARRVFISRELVKYTWTVEPIEIEDRYRVTVETTFETNVPAPVVTVEPASLDVSDLETLGQTKVVNMTIENHGFIAADHGAFSFGTHPFYEITPLIANVGVIPAKSSIVVPVTLRRIGEYRADGTIRRLGESLAKPAALAPRAAAPTPVPCSLSGNFFWDYICGPSKVGKGTLVAVSGVQGHCPGAGPGGGIIGGTGGGGAGSSSVSFSTPTLCDCFFEELCLEASKKVELKAIGDALAAALSAALPPWIRIESIDVTVEGDGKLCICCKDKKYGLSGSATATAKISGKAIIGFSGGGNVSIDTPGWTNVSASVSALAGARAEISGSVSLSLEKECHEEGTICVGGAVSLSAFAGIELDGSASGTWKVPNTNISVGYSGTARGALGINGSAKASVKGCLNGSLKYEACASFGPEATLSLQLKAAGYPDQTLGGSLNLPRWEAGSCAAGEALSSSFIGPAQKAAAPIEFTVPGAQYLRSDAVVIAETYPHLYNQSGVCAKVKLKLSQDAVLTRTAFRATLDLENKLPDAPLTGISIALDVRDAQGQPAGEVLNSRVTELRGFGAIDGTGQLAALGTGSAQWTLIPRDTAAPLQETVYTVGGTISYLQGGTRLTIPLEAVPITVKPDAALFLKYFHQRDVFSDDPHTDPTEPSIPYSLAVLVENRGAGAANNLRITSAQPQIVDNEKGLFIDFKVIASEVAGQNLSPSLTADFGTIAPGGRKVATWLLTSTLQGLFLDYKATFEHLDGLGDPRISLLKEVEIHEMIHQIEALGALSDGLPDFLVNDVPDLDDRPDTVHLSDGTTAPVGVIETATAGPVTANTLVVTLNANLGAGWKYLRVPDPGAGQFRLKRVVRSDGLVLPLDRNVWVTDRTFIGLGRRPIYENILHLADFASTGSYTLTYEPAAGDGAAPQSRVSSLPAASGVQIPVEWSGSDNVGIAGYDIYVSVDGGAFTRWQTDTPATGAIYSGEFGRSYAFYSVAIDGAGNREAAPATPDTMTAVSLNNVAPLVAAIANQTVNEGDVWTAQIVASDPDAPLTYELLAGAPGGMSIDQTGALRWVTGENNGGDTSIVTVRVTDNGAPRAATLRTFAIQVVETNSAPVLLAPGAQSATVGREFLLPLNASDRDTPAQTLSFAIIGSAPAGLSVNGAGLVSWTPLSTQIGSHIVTVRVTDNGANPAALGASVTFPITVASAAGSTNLSPRALGFEQVFVPVNAPPALVDLTTAFSDLEDGASGLTYALAGNSNAGLFNSLSVNPATQQLMLDFKPNTAGSATLTLEATDSGLLSATSVLQVRVTADPYEIWLFKYFPTKDLINPALQATRWGATADPDADQMANLFEWALLRDPTVPDRSALGISLDPSRQVRLGFERNALALSRVDFGLSVSTDLAAWRPLAAQLSAGLPGADAGDGTQRQSVTAIDPSPLPATRAEAAAAEERIVVDGTPATGDQLGRAVSIDGTTAAFGIPNADAGGADAGAVVIVEREAAGANWSFVQEVRAADAQAGDNFGNAVSLSGNTLAVGAYNAGGSSGAVYLFGRDVGGVGAWGQIAKISAPDAAAGDAFGFSVALSGDALVVGAFGDDDFGSSSGSAYVFTRQAGQWLLAKKLRPLDSARGDTFGYAVALDGDLAVVGSRWDDDLGSSSGSAYVFRRAAGGANLWGQVQKLVPAGGAANDQFGHAVAISGTTIVVGAPFHDSVQPDGGAAYVFTPSGAAWTQAGKLAPATIVASARFGHSVAVRGTAAVIGARFDGAGSAYLYRSAADGLGWALDFSVRASDGAAADEFGAAVGVAEEFIAIGAPVHPAPAATGAGYIYPLNPGASLQRFYRLDLQVK